MKIRASIVTAGLLFGGITAATASPAEAATPRCTGKGDRGNFTAPEYIWFPAHSPSTPLTILDPTGNWVIYGHGFWSCSLVQGSTGGGVKQLQVDINACYRGQLAAPLSEDGNFGPKTKAALVKVQQWHGIEANGQYGPQTARTMQHRVVNLDLGERCRTLAQVGYPGDSG